MFEKYSAAQNFQGNMILTHGLNLNPEKLMELTKWFQSLGFDVYLLRYSGHQKGDRPEHFSMKASIESLKQLVNSLNGNYYFCGFSLGCLIYALAVKENKIPEARKNLFLSPAFRPTLLIQLSKYLPANFKIPSRIYKDYQFHKGLPAFVYKDVFVHSDRLMELPFQNATLVFMDRGDLALNVKDLVELTKNYQQQIYSFRKTPAPHHLMVDEHSVGEKNWALFQQQIHQFMELS
ncbi:MAG: serine aminopeptidase domain-containing protein [Bacteriovoracaceae bacterium]